MEILDSKLRHEKKKPPQDWKVYNSYFSNMIGFVKNLKEI